MFEYKTIITSRIHLNTDLAFYQNHGWEIVSHAICPNNNMSILIRKEKGNEVDVNI